MKTRQVVLRGKLQGMKRDSSKLEWHLLPWEETESVLQVLGFGKKVYGENNWQKVESGEIRYRNAAHRHLAAIGKGEYLDQETGLPHYAHALCSLLFAFWHSRRNHGKADRNDASRKQSRV
jgi:hypothetical protein